MVTINWYQFSHGVIIFLSYLGLMWYHLMSLWVYWQLCVCGLWLYFDVMYTRILLSHRKVLKEKNATYFKLESRIFCWLWVAKRRDDEVGLVLLLDEADAADHPSTLLGRWSVDDQELTGERSVHHLKNLYYVGRVFWNRGNVHTILNRKCYETICTIMGTKYLTNLEIEIFSTTFDFIQNLGLQYVHHFL